MAPRRLNIPLRQPHNTLLGVPEAERFWKGSGGHVVVTHEGLRPLGNAEVHHISMVIGRGKHAFHYAVYPSEVQGGLRLEIKPRWKSSSTPPGRLKYNYFLDRINDPAIKAVMDWARASGYVPEGSVKHTISQTEPNAVILFKKSKQ